MEEQYRNNPHALSADVKHRNNTNMRNVDLNEDDTEMLDVAGNADPFEEYANELNVDRQPLTSLHSQTWLEYLRTIITAEPVTIFFFFATGLTDPAMKSLAYDKVCLQEYNYNHTICDNLHNESYKTEEDKVQSITSHWFLYAHLAYELPSIVSTFVCGAIGDHFSRRLALAMPLIGQILAYVNLILLSVYMDSHVSLILVSMITNGIFGGTIAMRTGVFSMIGEVSSPETRTKRISIGQGVEALSHALAYAVSGIILDNTSYETVFTLGLIISLLGFIYCFTWLKIPPRQEKMSTEEAAKRTCSLEVAKKSVGCIIKKRENRKRLRLISIMISIFFGMVSHTCKYYF